jgi:hypothetical protein
MKAKYVKPEAKDLGPAAPILGRCKQGNDDGFDHCTNGNHNVNHKCLNGNENVGDWCGHGNHNVGGLPPCELGDYPVTWP